MRPTATTRLLDAFRASQGNCTDYRAAKLLQVSDSTVSRWRTGVGHMSMANIARACELGDVGNPWEWQIRIGAEREQGPDGDPFRDALADLDRVKAGDDPSPSGIFAMLKHAGHAAIILIACIISVGAAPVLEKPAFSSVSATSESAGNFPY